MKKNSKPKGTRLPAGIDLNNIIIPDNLELKQSWSNLSEKEKLDLIKEKKK